MNEPTTTATTLTVELLDDFFTNHIGVPDEERFRTMKKFFRDTEMGRNMIEVTLFSQKIMRDIGQPKTADMFTFVAGIEAGIKLADYYRDK